MWPNFNSTGAKPISNFVSDQSLDSLGVPSSEYTPSQCPSPRVDILETTIQVPPAAEKKGLCAESMLLPGQASTQTSTQKCLPQNAVYAPHMVLPAPPQKPSVHNKISGKIDKVDVDSLTQKRLVAPVIGPDGKTYSKDALLTHLQKSKAVLPNSSVTATNDELFKNYAMQTRLDLLAQYGQEHDRSKYLTCPITLEQFVRPVVASDGHTYEYRAIRRIVSDAGISPITREILKPVVYYNQAIGKLLGVRNTNQGSIPCSSLNPNNEANELPPSAQPSSLETNQRRSQLQQQRELELNQPVRTIAVGPIAIGAIIGAGTVATVLSMMGGPFSILGVVTTVLAGIIGARMCVIHDD